jgi:hypothetical protein
MPSAKSLAYNYAMPTLTRNSTEKIKLLSEKTVNVPKCRTCFKKWCGRKHVPNYGGKAILNFEGKPLFAELVVLRMLEKKGWHGVWVDSYGRKYRDGMPHVKKPVPLPLAQEKLLNEIRKKAGCRGGCFDVFAWRGKKRRFLELKRHRKDHIRKTQKRWLAAARRCKIKMSDLLIVEWHIAD